MRVIYKGVYNEHPHEFKSVSVIHQSQTSLYILFEDGSEFNIDVQKDLDYFLVLPN